MGLAINTVHQGDCVETLKKIPAGSIDLAFADPPFNIGYQYDVYGDSRSAREYVDWSKDWICGVFRALKPNGSFWLAIGDEYAAELKLTSQEAGFLCRSWVIWYYTFGVNCRRGFSRSHTHLFHFVKNHRDFTFNHDNPAIRVPSARQLVYADARANPKGRLPDNTWIFRPQNLPNGIPASHDTWYFPRVAGTFKEREGFHGCQMPENLLGRIIRISSNQTDVVLDPFAGSGTTLATARKLARHWIGIELSKDYVKQMRDRLRKIRVGDPLDGAEDPLKSAPSDNQGKIRGVLRSSPNVRIPRTKRTKRIRDELNRAVVAAYKASHQGFSTDYTLADPELNAGFIEKCTQLGIAGEPVVWNQTLLRVRKQGKLPKLAKPHRRITFREMDSFSYASEVALHRISVEFDVTLDGILCDPELAALFDRTAGQFASDEHTPFEYRWAALALRKRAKLAKRLAQNYRAWLTDDLPEAEPIDTVISKNYNQPGIYALIGRDELSLYIGETFNLGEKIRLIASTPSWMELEPESVRIITVVERGLHGLKSVLIQRENPSLNSQLLFPKLETAA